MCTDVDSLKSKLCKNTPLDHETLELSLMSVLPFVQDLKFFNLETKFIGACINDID